MALGADLSLDALADWLRVASFRLDLTDALQISRQASGSVILDEVGQRLWTMDMTLVPQPSSAGHSWRDARLQLLREPGRTFAVGPRGALRFPKDPATAVGAATCTLAGAAEGDRDIILSGMTPGAKLLGGDYISVSDIASGRQHFFQIVNGGTASGSGFLPVEVVPPVPAVITGGTVQLHNPWFRAVLVPGSYAMGARVPAVQAGASLTALQTLRGVV